MRALLLSLLLSAAPATAAEPLPADAAAVWSELSQDSALRARFTQTRYSSLLKEPLVSEGTLAFERPDKLRWETTTPMVSAMVLRGSTAAMSYPELGVNEVIDLGSSPEATRIVASMTTWLGGDLAALQADYALQWTPGEPAVAVLTPKAPELKAMFTEIRLRIASGPTRIEHIEVIEPSGDRVEIALRDIVRPNAHPPDTFALPK